MMSQKQKIEDLKSEMVELKNYIKKLESNKTKLLKSLQIKNDKENYFNVHLPESSLDNFFHHDKCDQKLLAILYWDKLTSKQKDVFSDREEMQIENDYKRRKQEIMTDPTKMRNYFLSHASPVLDKMLTVSSGNDTLKKEDIYAFKEVWEVLKGIITSANTRAPILDLRGKDVSAQIDEILSATTEGDLTFDEAKEYMSLVSSGFNLQELPKLMDKLEAIEMK